MNFPGNVEATLNALYRDDVIFRLAQGTDVADPDNGFGSVIFKRNLDAILKKAKAALTALDELEDYVNQWDTEEDSPGTWEKCRSKCLGKHNLDIFGPLNPGESTEEYLDLKETIKRTTAEAIIGLTSAHYRAHWDKLADSMRKRAAELGLLAEDVELPSSVRVVEQGRWEEHIEDLVIDRLNDTTRQRQLY